MNLWRRRITFAVFFVAVGVVLSFGVLVVWLGTYPDNVDPKNIYYVLWKHKLNNSMNLDDALRAMIGDTSRLRQVQGLTRDQLKTRFGYIRTLGKSLHIIKRAISPRECLLWETQTAPQLQPKVKMHSS